MGKIIRGIFGGPSKSKQSSQSTSQSGNQAYGLLSNALAPNLAYTGTAGNLMSALLGANGEPAQTDALQRFSNSSGMQFVRQQGEDAITRNKAMKGLLGSGSYGTALTKYNQDLSSTYLDRYMNGLKDLAGVGFNSANAISGAGNYGTSQSTSKGKSEGEKQGLLKSIGQAAAAAGGG